MQYKQNIMKLHRPRLTGIQDIRRRGHQRCYEWYSSCQSGQNVGNGWRVLMLTTVAKQVIEPSYQQTYLYRQSIARLMTVED